MTQIQKYLKKSFCEITKEDIKKLFNWMEYEKEYKVETQEKFRTVLKKFYKMIYGENQNYPDCVKWFSVKLRKDKKNKEKKLDIAGFLEEEEIKKLVNAAPTIQKKAFLACLYESGGRPEEFLRITNLDCKIDTDGAILMLRGKTGERRLRIIAFAKLLQQWLDINPLKNQNQFPIWISEATNYKNKSIGLKGANILMKFKR
jgi:integrase/recombinase XerD